MPALTRFKGGIGPAIWLCGKEGLRFGYRFEFENDPRTELGKELSKRSSRKSETKFIYRYDTGTVRKRNPKKQLSEGDLTKIQIRLQRRSRERSEDRNPKNYPKRSGWKQFHLQVQRREPFENTPPNSPKIVMYDAARG